MALGGGTFLVQNKILPGAYMNFVSVAQASTMLSERGIATLPLDMDWGPEGVIFTVELADFLANSQKIFGHNYKDDALKPMREIFKHAKTVHFFRLNSTGAKATNKFATAKYPGTRGNDLKIIIESNDADILRHPHPMKTAPRKRPCMTFLPILIQFRLIFKKVCLKWVIWCPMTMWIGAPRKR